MNDRDQDYEYVVLAAAAERIGDALTAAQRVLQHLDVLIAAWDETSDADRLAALVSARERFKS